MVDDKNKDQPCEPNFDFGDRVPISLNHSLDIKNIIGELFLEVSEEAKMIHKMLEAGYVFEFAPSVLNGKLRSVSILTHTGKKLGTQGGKI